MQDTAAVHEPDQDKGHPHSQRPSLARHAGGLTPLPLHAEKCAKKTDLDGPVKGRAGSYRLLQGTRARIALFSVRRRSILQLEVELHLSETIALKAMVTGGGLALDEGNVADQAVTGGIGEVVP